ncbi:MAG: corrinoid protein [Chloroflexi bacterium]|nr:corrinoid protein [Chloroflexota bacterium]
MNFQELSEMVIVGDHIGAEAWTQKALDSGISAKTIIDDGLIPGMDEVGRRFRENEYYMPDVLISARAMKISMALVRPLLAESGESTRGAVVIGTVQGDLHDIGKNLVGMMLEGAGYDVHDLGVDVSPEDFLKCVEENEAGILCMSALLTTTMPMMETTIKAASEAELRNKVKILVGGAPVSDAFAVRIGADGYAPDAARAVDLVNSIMGG